MSVPRITEDKRRICSLEPHNNSDGYCVGANRWMPDGQTISRIESYEEPGQGAMVPWFAVYVGDEIRWRVPAHMVTVEYADE